MIFRKSAIIPVTTQEIENRAMAAGSPHRYLLTPIPSMFSANPVPGTALGPGPAGLFRAAAAAEALVFSLSVSPDNVCYDASLAKRLASSSTNPLAAASNC